MVIGGATVMVTAIMSFFQIGRGRRGKDINRTVRAVGIVEAALVVLSSVLFLILGQRC
jgi:hypothetical protein